MRALIILLAAMLSATTASAQTPAEAAAAPEEKTAGQSEQRAGESRADGLDDWNSLVRQFREAWKGGEMKRATALLERMLERRPHSGELIYRLAAAYAQSGEQSLAYQTLIRLQRQGLAYNPGEDPAFDPVSGTEVFDFIAQQLARNGEPFDRAETAFRTSQELRWPEGIAHDPESGAFFLSSMLTGRILKTTPEGESESFHESGEDGPAGFTALAVDPQRGVLWAAGTEVRTEGQQGMQLNARAARLYRFELEAGELAATYGIEEDRQLPHLLNEIVVAPDGTVFVSDSLSPLIFTLEPGSGSLSPFVGSGQLSSLQGLAIDDEGKYLFVADWHTGIYRIEIGSREVGRLRVPADVNLGGIHGLTFHDGDLIAIQTGTKPQRVVLFTLSDDLARIEGQQPLSAGQPEYVEPGLGVVAGEGFYFIANSGWGLEGAPLTTGAAPAVVLRADPSLGEEFRRGKANLPVRIEPAEGARHEAPTGFNGEKEESRAEKKEAEEGKETGGN